MKIQVNKITREANENPKRTRESPKEPWKLQGTLGNSQNSEELRKTPGNSEKLRRTPKTPGNSGELRKTPENSGERIITCLFFQILRITTQSTHGFKTEIPFNTLQIGRQKIVSQVFFKHCIRDLFGLLVRHVLALQFTDTYIHICC